MTGNEKVVISVISQSASKDQPEEETKQPGSGRYVEQRSGYVRISAGVVEQEQALKKVAFDQEQAGKKAQRQPHLKRTCELLFSLVRGGSRNQKCICSLNHPPEHSFVSALVRALPFSPTRLHLSTCV